VENLGNRKKKKKWSYLIYSLTKWDAQVFCRFQVRSIVNWLQVVLNFIHLGILELNYFEKMFVSLWFLQKVCFKFLVNYGDWRICFIPKNIFSELQFFVFYSRAFPKTIDKFKFWPFEWCNATNIGKWLLDDFWRVIKWCLNFLFGLSEMRNTACEDWIVAVKSLLKNARVHIEFRSISYSRLTISPSDFWGILLSSWGWIL